MRLASHALCLAATTALVGGCLVERQMPLPDDGSYVPYEETNRWEDEPTSEPERPFVEAPPVDEGFGSLPLQNPSLSGSVGTVSGLRPDRVTRLEGFGDSYWADVSTVGEGENGAAMTILTFEGGIDHEALRPGARLTFNLVEGSATDLAIYAIGCAGPATDVWEFDEPADEVIVEVSEDPNNPAVLVYSYEARFTGEAFGSPHEPSVVVGSFERVVQ